MRWPQEGRSSRLLSNSVPQSSPPSLNALHLSSGKQCEGASLYPMAMATESATTASVRYKHNKSAPVHAAPVETPGSIGQQNNISTSSSPASKGVLTSLVADGTATFVFVFVSSIFSQVRQWQGRQPLAREHSPSVARGTNLLVLQLSWVQSWRGCWACHLQYLGCASL